MPFKLQKIVVEAEAASYKLTQQLLARFASVKHEFVSQLKTRKDGFKANELILAKQKGRFVKKCPGTPSYNCCNYYVLNLGIGCFFNCTYCYLHYYMNSPYLLYVNIEDLLLEVKRLAQAKFPQTVRLGSGEFIDSLGFDELVPVHPFLIESFANLPNIVFEVKTKSNYVQQLLNLKHKGKTVVSWSVNPPAVIQQEEQMTASLEQRLKAAQLCQEAGYKVGFHFDPLIYYPNWQKDYKKVVALIFQLLKPETVAWISLGALRFKPELKEVMQEKFPHSKIVYGELVPGLDGKLRYFRPLRQKMFATLVSYIRSYSQDVPVYLCMENRQLAKAVGAEAPFNYDHTRRHGH